MRAETAYRKRIGSRAHALAEHHHIWNYLPVIAGPELAAARQSRLHFIKDQIRALAIADLTHALEIISRRHDNSRRRLHCLHYHGSSIARHGAFHGSKVAKWHARETGH